jgi:signal transduction histidine kinase/CheY-like chemotaxis protein
MATYFNYVICTIFIHIFSLSLPENFYRINLVFHAVYWINFFLLKKGKDNFSKHLFLFNTYAMLAYCDHFFGYQAFTFTYFIAFIPTAIRIFSFTSKRGLVLFHLFIPIIYFLVSSLLTYNLFPPHPKGVEIAFSVRIMNCVLVFAMAFTYTIYNLILNERKQESLLLRGSSLQTTLDNATGAIWTIDKNYKLITANISFRKYVEANFGMKDVPNKTYIKPYLEAMDDGFFIKKLYQPVLNGNIYSDNLEHRGKIYETRGIPIYDENSVLIGATFTSKDVTLRLQDEEKLKEALRNANIAAESKERFINNMSHELRTPLNGIIGISNILLEENHLPSQNKYLQNLQHLSDHTLQLVNNVLNLAKINAGKSALNIAPFNLKLFLVKFSGVFESLAEQKKLQFTIEEIGNTNLQIQSDETKLNQVLINLVANAVKFTETGFVKLQVIAPEIITNNQIDLKFKVIDTGIGISKENQEKIFEVFTQLDTDSTRKYQGTGLGITISDKILQLFNSKLCLDSELNKGTTFWFNVNVEASIIKEGEMAEHSIEDYYGLKGAHILLAEDNQVNQLVVRHILDKWSVNLTIVENGEQALAKAANYDFNIILMDLDMPIMDGYEATAKIKHLKPKANIVALTAAAFEDMEAHLLNNGFNGMIQKPFKKQELYAQLILANATV